MSPSVAPPGAPRAAILGILPRPADLDVAPDLGFGVKVNRFQSPSCVNQLTLGVFLLRSKITQIGRVRIYLADTAGHISEPMAGSPLKPQRRLGVRLEDGRVIAFPRMRRVAAFHPAGGISR